jgi:3-dehydroquinate synthase
MSPSIEIASQMGNYVVHFEDDIGSLIAILSKGEGNIVIVDELVARLYPSLADRSRFPHLIEVEATEGNKTLGECEAILKFMSENGAHKGTHLIGIGGGIIQDLVTFCAHVYFRGLEWTFVPTTLLGMADSCIGAKASINFLGYKNQLGVFHSPRNVWISTEFLRTLPDSEIRSGYGEIVKLHLIKGPEYWKDLLSSLQSGGLSGREHGASIRASLEIKKAVIEVDEFDRGVRKKLNYGHTFGHALESITNHTESPSLGASISLTTLPIVTAASRRLSFWRFTHALRNFSHGRSPLLWKLTAS